LPDDVLTSYLLATGSDGYQVFFSLAELNPAFGAPQDLVAYAIDGGVPGISLGSNGLARLAIQGDLHGGRFVSNLASFQVAAVPAPAALLLLAAGAVGLDLGRKRPRHLPRERRIARPR